MKLQFKYQQFQHDAAQAVVGVFCGQTRQDAFTYRMDMGSNQIAFDTLGFCNPSIQLKDEELTRNIRQIQFE